jgi:hypothetical protein
MNQKLLIKHLRHRMLIILNVVSGHKEKERKGINRDEYSNMLNKYNLHYYIA